MGDLAQSPDELTPILHARTNETFWKLIFPAKCIIGVQPHLEMGWLRYRRAECQHFLKNAVLGSSLIFGWADSVAACMAPDHFP